MSFAVINFAYLVAAILFIYGLKGLTHPRTAVRGNLTGALGMFLAIIATLLIKDIVDYKWIIAGIIVGGSIGALLAVKIEMTAMPQLVAFFNGFGGAASVLVAGAALFSPEPAEMNTPLGVAPAVSGLIGAATCLGGFGARGKVEGVIFKGGGVLFLGEKVR
nr:NAD(P)(+) transhydrogenase (Re/Si-specific) subunit beta [FCB group bacterium]